MAQRVTRVLVTVTSGDAVQVAIRNHSGQTKDYPTLAPGEAKYFGLFEGEKLCLSPVELEESFRDDLELKG